MRKFLIFLLCFVPTIVYFLIQVIAGVSAGIFYAIMDGVASDISELTMYVCVAQGLIGFLVFGLWYEAGFKELKTSKLCKIFSWKRVFSIILMAFSFQIVISFFLGFAEIIFPSTMQDYSELMDNLVIKESFASILYCVIIAPITEELVFRGVTLNLGRRIFPYWIAIILQAFLFGVLHMNIVQGTYAFLIGIVMGMVYKRYNSLYATILFHIATNGSGVLLSMITTPINGITYLLLIAVSFVIAFGSIYVMIRDERNKKTKIQDWN